MNEKKRHSQFYTHFGKTEGERKVLLLRQWDGISFKKVFGHVFMVALFCHTVCCVSIGFFFFVLDTKAIGNVWF